MTAKDCGHRGETRRQHRRRILAALLLLTVAALLAFLLVWLILRPTKPHFVLQDAAVRAFNLSASGNILTASLQVTLSARNPNGRIGIYYDRAAVYATYRGQQVTLAAGLPPSYQGHEDTTVWSPLLNGSAVPLAPYLAAALGRDKAAGAAPVNVRVDGQVRWKVGTFVSGRYHLHVNCPAYIYFRNNNNNYYLHNNNNNNNKYQLIMDCHVDV